MVQGNYFWEVELIWDGELVTHPLDEDPIRLVNGAVLELRTYADFGGRSVGGIDISRPYGIFVNGFEKNPTADFSVALGFELEINIFQTLVLPVEGVFDNGTKVHLLQYSSDHQYPVYHVSGFDFAGYVVIDEYVMTLEYSQARFLAKWDMSSGLLNYFQFDYINNSESTWTRRDAEYFSNTQTYNSSQTNYSHSTLTTTPQTENSDITSESTSNTNLDTSSNTDVSKSNLLGYKIIFIFVIFTKKPIKRRRFLL